MKAVLFWKYTKRAVILQLVLCVVVWITSLWLDSDLLFGAMFTLYIPTIYLIDIIPHSPGFGGGVVFGMLIGMLVYGVILGAVMSYVKSRQSR